VLMAMDVFPTPPFQLRKPMVRMLIPPFSVDKFVDKSGISCGLFFRNGYSPRPENVPI